MLVQRAGDIDWAWFEGVDVLGLSAGASAPEILIEEVIEAARGRFDVSVREVAITQEDVVFKVPRVLKDVKKEVA
jgi:4-hydroxy-3-methylbut-2-enyl diphosphate reductase